jgi:ATP-dependent DNA helicase RecQ
MKVVIVAKTRRGRGACVGALTPDGRSLRLEAADALVNEFAGLEYEVGEVWDVDALPDPETVPPHVENVIVRDKKRLGRIGDPVSFIQRQMPPRVGGLEVLYQRLAQATGTGALYIAERTGIPAYSTTFWRPDRDLLREHDGKRIRYRYPAGDGGRTLTFVGFQEPVEKLQAGSLLRVSLAHWWRPAETPEAELRCYVQLSGWFLDQSPRLWPAEPLAVGSRAAEPDPPTAPEPAPGMAAARQILQDTFGFDDFWPMQEEVIQNILCKADTLAVMPTGSGKSLCYQLPALLFQGLTVVVSPLISLMQDQVDQLREMDISAVFLNSSLNHAQYVQTMRRIRQGQVRLLYVAPETLLRPETLLLLEQSGVDCLTVDEAHCISAWGHDFRPEYRQLIDVRHRLPRAVCFALTATATPRVQEDICRQLGIEPSNTYLASFDRPNLYLSVQAKVDARQQLLGFLDQRRGQSGIVYCATRAQVDNLAADLSGLGYSVLPYHAGLDELTRRRHQRQFSRDEVQIVVATVAFGMGINKANVRFVVHYDLPKDIESYYQEIGRSGRDGLQADCLLLFSLADAFTIRRFFNEKEPAQRREAEARLRALMNYAESTVCRRRTLLPYFGESYEQASCGICDNCLEAESDEPLVDMTVEAQMFLSCVKRTGECFGLTYIVGVLRGSRDRRILEAGHDRLTTHGIGRATSQKAWRHMAGEFIRLGLLVRNQHGGLQLTARAYDVFRGEPVRGRPFQDEARQTEAVRKAVQEHDAVLFEILRARRLELADDAGVPAFAVFSDRSLIEMATYYPQSSEAFSRIYGVGRAKLERYAGEFLPLIRDYCQAKGVAEKVRPVPPAAKGGRTLEVAGAYQAGESIDQIAARLGVQRATIVKSLYQHHQAGNELRSDGLLELIELPAREKAEALAAFEEHGTDFLKPVFEALDQRVGYDQLHLLRLYLLTAR